jgi:general stress protein 26
MTDQAARDRRSTLYDLIKDIKFAMFTTHKPQGHLHSRPMTTQNKSIDDEDQLWFFMSRSSETVAEFQGDDQVNVSYADPGSDTYVSVSGIANVVENPLKKKSLWTDEAAAWFKGGPEDPDLALVCVQIEHADYWNVKDNKLVQLYKRAEAALTGKASRPGEHGRFQPH